MTSKGQPQDQPRNQFTPARAKLWIGSLDDPQLEVRAQYNPHQLQIDKSVPWQEHKSRNNQTGSARDDESQQSDLEFNEATQRTMTIELLFDGYEQNRSVEDSVNVLEALSTVRDPKANQAHLRRPHHCIVAWGDMRDGMAPFRCVIESLGVKYTVWSSTGAPLRATCTVKLKEAEKMEWAPREEYGIKGYDEHWEKELRLREAARDKQIKRTQESAQGSPRTHPEPAAKSQSNLGPKTAAQEQAEYRQREYDGLSADEARKKRHERGMAALDKPANPNWKPGERLFTHEELDDAI